MEEPAPERWVAAPFIRTLSRRVTNGKIDGGKKVPFSILIVGFRVLGSYYSQHRFLEKKTRRNSPYYHYVPPSAHGNSHRPNIRGGRWVIPEVFLILSK